MDQREGGGGKGRQRETDRQTGGEERKIVIVHVNASDSLLTSIPEVI